MDLLGLNPLTLFFLLLIAYVALGPREMVNMTRSVVAFAVQLRKEIGDRAAGAAGLNDGTGNAIAASLGLSVPVDGTALICPLCSTPNPADSKFCRECGAKLEPAAPLVACPACGNLNHAGDRYCGECGALQGERHELAA